MLTSMRVFISWSGFRSRLVAEQLNQWFPLVLQHVTPFMSAEDVDKGARWSGEIAGVLDTSNYGVVCLTPENLEAPWIHFEAGALSKSVAVGRVSPLLLGIKKSDVIGPLAQFQLTTTSQDDVFRLVKSINNASSSDARVDDERLGVIFSTFWPTLVEKLSAAENAGDSAEGSRDGERDPTALLEEVLETVRSHTRMLSTLQRATGSSAASVARRARNEIRAVARSELGPALIQARRTRFPGSRYEGLTLVLSPEVTGSTAVQQALLRISDVARVFHLQVEYEILRGEPETDGGVDADDDRDDETGAESETPE